MRKIKWKSWAITLSAFCIPILSTISVYAKDINEVPDGVYEQMETNNFLTGTLRGIGDWLYGLMKWFLDIAETGFNDVAKFDFMAADTEGKTNGLSSLLSGVMTNIQTVLYSILFICFVIVVVIRLFKLENNLKTLYNGFLVLMAVAMFSTLFSLMNTAKNDLMSITGDVFSKKDFLTSEKIFLDNTYDFEQSLKKDKLITLSAEDVPKEKLKYLNTDVLLEKDGEGGLNQFYTIEMDVAEGKSNWNKVEKDLDGGFLGMFEISYYRFKPNWVYINMLCFITFFIYLLAVFKIGYLLHNWLSFYVFGQFALGKGFMDVSHIGKALKEGVSTALGFVVLYASMQLFTLISTGIMNSFENNVLVQGILILSVGMSIITGSGFINDFLGIDDGSTSALKNMFMARQLGRIVGSGAKAGGRFIKDRGQTAYKDAKSAYKEFKQNKPKAEQDEIKDRTDKSIGSADTQKDKQTYESAQSEKQNFKDEQPKTYDEAKSQNEHGSNFDKDESQENLRFENSSEDNEKRIYDENHQDESNHSFDSTQNLDEKKSLSDSDQHNDMNDYLEEQKRSHEENKGYENHNQHNPSEKNNPKTTDENIELYPYLKKDRKDKKE